ncbi:hypothetical protein KI387_025717, partial [Taxus chinensis]
NKKVNDPVRQKEKSMNVWEMKLEQDNQKEKSMLIQIAMHALNEENQWYIDSGCSSHMTGDRNKFISLKEVNGSIVKFGDNATTRVIGG